MEVCLIVFSSEAISINLGIVYSKTGLDDATADKFAKQNGVKINNKNDKSEINTNENVRDKNTNTTTYQVATSREILEAGSLTEYSWLMFTRTKLLNYVQKPTKLTSTWSI